MRIRKGDNVEVITGKQKGKKGVVERILVEEKRVIVEGVNMVKRHQKGGMDRAGKSRLQGGIIEKPAPMDVSDVMLVCPHCNLKTRVGFKKDGKKKMRICKQCGKEIN